MKANELMIGDWVYMEANRGYKAQYIQVETIPDASSKDHYGHIGAWPVGGDNDFRDIEDRHLFPIPITPEILEKNGFREILFNGYPSEIYRYDTVRSGYIIELGVYSPNFINIQWKEFGIDGWKTGELASFVKKDGSNYMVHELQHALRLCGIDNEITL